MKVVLGIDVAKATFDVALRLHEKQIIPALFDNTAAGFVRLEQWLRQHTKQKVHACLEATGRYGEALAEYLLCAGHQVSVVNPSRIHHYGRSKLRRTKTDKSDAKLIADFCATQQPPLWVPHSEHQQELQELTRQLDDLKQSRQRISNRLGSGLRSKMVQRLLGEQLRLLDEQIRELEAAIAQHIRQDEQCRQRFQLLISIPAIGPITAAKFLAEVPDIRFFASADQLAAYAGLVPRHAQSGAAQGKSTLAKTGNTYLRTAFYMPALSAERFNPLIANFAARLRAATLPKSKMTIVTAIMHKLLVLAYGVLKSGCPFDPNFAATHQPIT